MGWRTRWRRGRSAGRMTRRGAMEQTVEHRGGRLAWRRRGEGAPVVFIQGVGVAGSGWEPQIDELAARYACVWFDNRGIGGSQPLDPRITVPGMAGDAIAVFDAAGIASAHVVGHSLGGLVALQLALTAPARVKSLALLCTFANGSAAAPLSLRMLRLGLGARIGTVTMRRRAFTQLLLPPKPRFSGPELDRLADRLAPVFGHDLATQPPVATSQLRAMRAANLTPRLAELAGLPTLVVSGTHDPIAPPALGRALAAGIPGARYVEYPDGSHGLPIQLAARLNGLLASHFG